MYNKPKLGFTVPIVCRRGHGRTNSRNSEAKLDDLEHCLSMFAPPKSHVMSIDIESDLVQRSHLDPTTTAHVQRQRNAGDNS